MASRPWGRRNALEGDGPASFAVAWEKEVASTPEFAASAFHIVIGLLLPIWKRIPDGSMRVYRLQTDTGERIIGRLLSDADLATLCRNLGAGDAPELSADEIRAALLKGETIAQLADGLALRRVRVMHDHRIELTGFSTPVSAQAGGMVDRLKAMGLIAEIISWKLRLFVPTGAAGQEIFARLTARYPLISHQPALQPGNAQRAVA